MLVIIKNREYKLNSFDIKKQRFNLHQNYCQYLKQPLKKMKTPITVAIVEDNAHLREALFELINDSDGYKCVGAWANAEDLILRIRCTHPQVVLMDIELQSRTNGIEATRQVKAAFPEINVLIQTIFEDDEKVFQSLQAGATGYILKNMPIEKLLESLSEAAQGHAPLTPCIAQKIISWLPKSLPVSKQSPSVSTLSERQKEVLDGIIAGKNYKILANELFISADTVRFHIKKIYELLQVHSKYELIMKFKNN